MIKKDYYKGKRERCFIVGTGNSLNNIDVSFLKDEITISFNQILLKPDFTPNYLCVGDTTVLENSYDLVFNDRMKNGYYVICNGCVIADKHYPNGYGNCNKNPGSTCRGIQLEDKYNNIHIVKHNEKSGIFLDHMDMPERTKLLKTDEYFIDSDFKTITCYGGGTVDNICIPLAVYLGFKEIYLIGCDASWGHFYDDDERRGRREWINFRHVVNLLEKQNIKLINTDPTNVFSELEYINYKELV